MHRLANFTHSSYSGLLQLCLAGVLAGTTGLTAQLVLQGGSTSPITIASYRVGGGAVVMVAIMLVLRRIGNVYDALRQHPFRVTAVGLLTGSVQALYFVSIAFVGVTIATVVALGTAPVLLALREARQRHRWPGKGTVVRVVAAVTGLGLVSGAAGGGGGGSHPAAGVLAALATGTVYATSVVLSESVAREADALSLTTATSAVATLGLAPVVLFAGDPFVSSGSVALVGLVYLGIVTFTVPTALIFAGLRSTPSSAAVLATLLEPVTAAVLAAVVLGERVGATGVLGILLVLAAVAALAVGRDDAQARPERHTSR